MTDLDGDMHRQMQLDIQTMQERETGRRTDRSKQRHRQTYVLLC